MQWRIDQSVLHYPHYHTTTPLLHPYRYDSQHLCHVQRYLRIFSPWASVREFGDPRVQPFFSTKASAAKEQPYLPPSLFPSLLFFSSSSSFFLSSSFVLSSFDSPCRAQCAKKSVKSLVDDASSLEKPFSFATLIDRFFYRTLLGNSITCAIDTIFTTI